MQIETMTAETKKTENLSPELLDKMDAYWRAANDLSVETFLAAHFSGAERHNRRLAKVRSLESQKADADCVDSSPREIGESP